MDDEDFQIATSKIASNSITAGRINASAFQTGSNTANAWAAGMARPTTWTVPATKNLLILLDDDGRFVVQINDPATAPHREVRDLLAEARMAWRRKEALVLDSNWQFVDNRHPAYGEIESRLQRIEDTVEETLILLEAPPKKKGTKR